MESGGQPTQSQHRREGDEHAGHQCDGHGEDEDVAIDSDVLATRQIAWRQSHEQPKDCDGADQVEVDQLVTLLLNPFSVRQKAFICSRIAQVLGTAVFDVDRASQGRGVYVVGGDAPRDNDEKLLGHLWDRYPGEMFHRFATAWAGTV